MYPVFRSLTVLLLTVSITSCWLAGLSGSGSNAASPGSGGGTGSPGGDTTPPGEVSGLSVDDRRNQSIELTWSNPGDSDFAGVEITYGLSTPDTPFTGSVDPSGTVIGGLTNGTDYQVRLRTIDEAGNLSNGVTVSAGPVEAQFGDGILHNSEECDDGNGDKGDGCSDTGTIEIGWSCEGSPSVCTYERGIEDLSAGDLVITEIMPKPDQVSDSDGKWFEVYIEATQSVDLKGLEIRDNSASYTVGSNLIVSPGEYLVFGPNGDTSENGGVTVDYELSGLSLSNSGETLELLAESLQIDQVAYESDWPYGQGTSMQLDPASRTAADNDGSDNWCASSATYGEGDAGTPGASNANCP